MASREKKVRKNSHKTRTPEKMSNRLRVLLVEREMTFEDLAEESTVSEGALWRISNGGNCTVRTVLRIMKALDCEAVDIYPNFGKGAKE